jgi:hypothetical protein
MRHRTLAGRPSLAIARLRPNYVSSLIARGATADEQTEAAEKLLRRIHTWVRATDQIFATEISYRFSVMGEQLCIDLVCRRLPQGKLLLETIDHHIGLTQEENEDRERQAWRDLLVREFRDSVVDLLGQAARSTAVFRTSLNTSDSGDLLRSESTASDVAGPERLRGIDDAHQGNLIYALSAEGSESYAVWGDSPPVPVRVRPELNKGGYMLHVIAGPPEFAKRKISLLAKDLDKQSFLTIAEAAWDRHGIELHLRVASTTVRGHSLIGKLERIGSTP